MSESPIVDSPVALLAACDVEMEEVEALGLSADDLFVIYQTHLTNTHPLQETAEGILRLLATVDSVHSVRARVKGPCRLVRKIVRKARGMPARHITSASYQVAITDLVGLRALHLFKEEWQEVHDFITATFVLHERPTAYIREGDPKQWTTLYESRQCDVRVHPRNYRSVHYVVNTGLAGHALAEIQVRTVLEEAWSEVDHRINYPEPTRHSNVGAILRIFNRLAGGADEIASFANALEGALRESDHRVQLLSRDLVAQQRAASELVRSLEVTERERTLLLERIAAIERIGDERAQAQALASRRLDLSEAAVFRSVTDLVRDGNATDAGEG